MHRTTQPGQGILLITHEIPPDVLADCEAWFVREHLPERLAVPGFLRGRRFRGIEGTLGFLVIYDTVSADVLATPAYHARLAQPTAWTTRIMQRFQNMRRSALRVEGTFGAVDGSAVALWEIPRSIDASAVSRLADQLADLAKCAGVCVTHLWLDAGIASPVTAEAKLRGVPDATVPGALCVEVLDQAALSGVATAFDAALSSGIIAPPRCYALQCTGTASGSRRSHCIDAPAEVHQTEEAP